MNRLAALACLLAFAFGCAGTKAYSDFDPNARFDTYRSFAWVSEDAQGAVALPEGTTKSVDPLLARRIRDTIDAHLEARGYERRPNWKDADFAVAFSVGSREKIQIQSTPTMAGGWYGGYGGWYAGSTVSARSYTEGTLAIDVFDVASHQAVWHGWASKRVSPDMDRAKVVDEVVGAILEKFPPQR
jgi:hypothetical protein